MGTPRAPEEFMVNLLNGEFDKIWEGEELDSFHEFLYSHALEKAGFVLTVELEEGGLMFFFYQMEELVIQRDGNKLSITLPEVFIPREGIGRELPDALKEYPVFHVDTESKNGS